MIAFARVVATRTHARLYTCTLEHGPYKGMDMLKYRYQLRCAAFWGIIYQIIWTAEANTVFSAENDLEDIICDIILTYNDYSE